MKASPVSPLLPVLLALAPVGAAAQQLAPAPIPGSARVSAPRARATAPAPHRAPFFQILAFGAGGSLLGGWTGFMTSQVIWSDWQRGTINLGPKRLRFTIGGAALGSVAGVVFGFHHHPRTSPPSPAGPLVRAGSITAEEIRACAARDAEEAVRLLRPRWLNPRGRDLVRIDAASLDSTARKVAWMPNPEPIRVYLDESLLGGLDQLATVSAEAIVRIEWWDPGAATLRWGAGHSHGAIRIVTSLSEP